jgi:hypothetical protein
MTARTPIFWIADSMVMAQRLRGYIVRPGRPMTSNTESER